MNSVVKMTFNVNIAKELDVNCAIVYANLEYWCFVNQKQNKNLFAGRYYSYNTYGEFTDLFEWLSVSQIRRTIKKLVDAGYLKCIKPNEQAGDNTNYYTVLKSDNTLNIKPDEIGIGSVGIDRGTVGIDTLYKEHIITTDNNIYIAPEEKIEFASDWMQKHAKSLFDSAQMKRPKHVKESWPKVLDHFNAVVLKESLRYEPRVLFGRLLGVINNWKNDGNTAQDVDRSPARKMMV